MNKTIKNLKILRVLTKPEEIKRFLETEGTQYGLKPIDPEPPTLPDYPEIVFVEPWRREPSPDELRQEMQELRKQLALPGKLDPDAIYQYVKQRNALIAFYNEANGKQMAQAGQLVQ